MINLVKISNFCYRSDYGYFILDDQERTWTFLPADKELNKAVLLSIVDILENLNKENEK
jgi:hypothetical protein